MSESTSEELATLVGEIVSVTHSSIAACANGFHSSMSLRGRLERKDDTHYRVVVDDDLYTYFKVEDVDLLFPFSKGIRIFVKWAVEGDE